MTGKKALAIVVIVILGLCIYSKYRENIFDATFSSSGIITKVKRLSGGFTNPGTIVGALYEDSDGDSGDSLTGDTLTALTSIYWGMVEPGSSTPRPSKLKNEGTLPFMLTLSTMKYVPVNASNYITVTCDFNNQTIQPQEIRRLIFTLHVDYSVVNSKITTFSFDIVVTFWEV